MTMVGGIPKMQEVTATASLSYYLGSYTVVSGTPGSGEIGPKEVDQQVFLPDSGTYLGDELEVYLNGQVLRKNYDFQYSAETPTKTYIIIQTELVAGDYITFRKVYST